MKDEKIDILKKHGYSLTGLESGVKLCHWVGKKLIDDRSCYKEDFYGIQCHRCLQMSPVIDICNQRCLFCWRYQDHEERKSVEYDEPQEIVEKSILAQRELVSGFKGDQRCSKDMWREARQPNQVAISLAGEPTLYPYLGELIREYKKKGMTTFLVTNGTLPERLEELTELPTQLYLTLPAPNRKIYNRLCVPNSHENWKNIQRSLEVISTLETRTVVRHTLVKGWNIGWEKEYVDMIKKADPDFVEAKGYVFVGDSRRRMRLENMPSHDTVKDFGRKEARLLGWDILKEKRDSRVVLLGESGIEPKL